MSLGYCATAGRVLRRFERERRPDEFPTPSIPQTLFYQPSQTSAFQPSNPPDRHFSIRKDDPLYNQRRSPVEVAATAPRSRLSHTTAEVPCWRKMPVKNLGNGAMFRRAGGREVVYNL
ncbi:hypothetical protein R3P38DRAFT_3346246, partial [Favolaschia claudopus]